MQTHAKYLRHFWMRNKMINSSKDLGNSRVWGAEWPLWEKETFKHLSWRMADLGRSTHTLFFFIRWRRPGNIVPNICMALMSVCEIYLASASPPSYWFWPWPQLRWFWSPQTPAQRCSALWFLIRNPESKKQHIWILTSQLRYSHQPILSWAAARPDQCPTTIQLCSIGSDANLSDFLHSWGGFKDRRCFFS